MPLKQGAYEHVRIRYVLRARTVAFAPYIGNPAASLLSSGQHADSALPSRMYVQAMVHAGSPLKRGRSKERNSLRDPGLPRPAARMHLGDCASHMYKLLSGESGLPKRGKGSSLESLRGRRAATPLASADAGQGGSGHSGRETLMGCDCWPANDAQPRQGQVAEWQSVRRAMESTLSRDWRRQALRSC
ncbi:hypothetical protein ACSS6W_009698 [Trichoderma asperelloides]